MRRATEVPVAIVTTPSRGRLHVLGGSDYASVRSRPSRPRHGRAITSFTDLGLVTIALGSIVFTQAWALRGTSLRYRALVAAVALVCGSLSFVGVLAAEGAIHIPGTRTLASLTSRAVNVVTGAKAPYVQLPAGGEGSNPRAPGVRQVAPNPQPSDPAPNPAGTEQTVGGAQHSSSDPKATPTPETSPTLPVVDLPKPPPSARLKSVTHVWQSWNNCGPATVTMALSAIGRAESQSAAVAFLKTSSADKNVNPGELVEYVRSRGARTEWRTGGDLITLKRLIAADVPVIVEVGFEYDPGDWMGHYRLIVGYDDAAGRFIAYDSYQSPGKNVPQPYDAFDANWRAFNRSFLPVYLPAQGPEVAAIAGAPDDPALLERALARAASDVESNPTIAFAWFNLGTNLVAVNRMEEAAGAFDTARRLKLPWRMLWYQFAPFEAYLNTGRFDDVLTLANANLAGFPELEESRYYKGRALQALGKFTEARAEYTRALKANARFAPASYFLTTLPNA